MHFPFVIFGNFSFKSTLVKFNDSLNVSMEGLQASLTFCEIKRLNSLALLEKKLPVTKSGTFNWLLAFHLREWVKSFLVENE
jgi:hypothetical protein